MTKKVTHFCDFSSQVREHEAQFTISSRLADESTGLGSEEIDSCEKHLCNMLTALFHNGGTRCSIVKLPGVELDSLVMSRKSEVSLCNLCNQATRNMYSHYKSVHKLRYRAGGPPEKIL